jgi:hypothetical protein
MRVMRYLTFVPLVVLAGGCGTDPGEGTTPASVWTLATEPEFLVPGGVVEGDSVHFVSVSGGEILSDGNVVVVLGLRQNTLVVVAGTGEVVQVLGGIGDGPREFRSVPRLSRVDGRLVAFDVVRRRYLEVVGLDFGEAVEYERGADERELGLLSDGALVTTRTRSPQFREAHTEREPVTPYVLRTGATVDTLFGPSSPPLPNFVLSAPTSPSPMLAAAPDCLPGNHHVVADTALLIADASTGLVMSLGRTGTVDTLYRSPEPHGQVTEAMVAGAEAFIANVVDRARGPGSPAVQRGAFLEAVGRVGDPLRSVWREALWDGQLLWLLHAAPCLFGGERADPDLWDVIDLGTGSLVATVETPAGLRLIAVAPDRVLGVATDELGVEYVGTYAIAR